MLKLETVLCRYWYISLHGPLIKMCHWHVDSHRYLPAYMQVYCYCCSCGMWKSWVYV